MQTGTYQAEVGAGAGAETNTAAFFHSLFDIFVPQMPLAIPPSLPRGEVFSFTIPLNPG